MSKRCLSVIVVLLLILSCVTVIPAGAAAETVVLRTAEDIAALSADCVLDTWSAGKTVVLENDIDLSGHDFAPIPLFSGHLDGKGHTISGVKLTDAVMTAGFIRCITESGTVENLNISGEITPDGACVNVGGIVGENNGTVKNCSFSGTVSGYESVGGVCGLCGSAGVIEGCRVEGSVSGEHRAGGIVGGNSGIVRNCVSKAVVNAELTDATSVDTSDLDPSKLNLSELNLTLSAEELVDITDVGGIAGYSSGVIRGCENKGEIGHKHIGYNVGGIVGHLSGYVDGCVNSGKVFGRKDVGGIAGQTDPYTGWDFSGEKLTELKAKLGDLRNSITGLADDVESYSSELSSKLTGVMDSLSDADAALDTLSGDALSFVNDNIGAVNQLSERFTQGLRDLVPAMEELGSFLSGLPAVFDSLSAALDSLGSAAWMTDDVYKTVKANVTAAKNSVHKARVAVNQIKQSVSKFIKAPNISGAGELASTIVQKAGVIRDELVSAKNAVIAARDALISLPEAGEPAAEALDQLSQTADSIDAALGSLAGAEELLTSAMDDYSRYDALSFSPVNTDEDTRKVLFSSLGDSFTGFRSVAELLDESWLSDDARAISDSFFALVSFVTDAIGGGVTAKDANVLKDISSDGADRTQGTVKNCRNTSAIDAESNGGGVVGAISLDVSFDLEDEFNISSLLTGSVRYLIYACVTDCVNASAVTVKKESAGGIVGRMDYGTVRKCESGGEITAGSYAGGIAGLSRGTLQSCSARVNLSAGSYVGGIAGSGSDISGCCAMPSISERAAYCGSVAGEADGTVKGNYYSSCDIGGINGFSYAGKAEPVAHDELIKKSGSSELFGGVTVTFMKDGEVVSAVNVPFGGSVTDIPQIPDEDGRKWRWDSFDNTAIYRSMTVEGGYVSPVTVLSSGEDVPMFLVEGSFDEGQKLRVTPYGGASADESVTDAYTVSVDGYGGALKVHMRADGDGDVTVISPSGERKSAEHTRDGSYIVFELNSGDSFIYKAAQKLTWLYIAIGAGAAVIAVAALILLIRARKKRSAKTAEEKTE